MRVESARSVRIFAFLLFPMACWQVWIFPSIPNYYAQHFLLYPAGIFMLWSWWQKLWTVRGAWGLARPFCVWICVLLVAQALAGWESATQYAPGNAYWAVTKELLKLLVQVPFLLFFLLVCRVCMRDKTARRYMLWGALVSFALLTLLCLVQGLYVYGADHSLLAQTGLPGLCRDILYTLSPWIEARWPECVYDFYSKGSYTLTMARLNGFFEEASALSAWLAVFFVPLSFGLLALKPQGKVWTIAGSMGILTCLTLLILCRSTTGIALATVTLVLLLGRACVGPHKVLKVSAVVLVIACCVWGIQTLPRLVSFLQHKTQYAEQTPRIVILLDTIDIIKEHPLVGVGRGWYFAHLHDGTRYTKSHDHELHTWKAQGHGGELWALPGFTAQYGVPMLVAVLAFVGHTVWLLYRRSRNNPTDPTCLFMAQAALVWAVMAFVASLALLDIRNPLFCLPFFCFYVWAYGVDTCHTGETTP